MTSIQTSPSDSDVTNTKIKATDRLTGELLLLECDQLIVATDPEAARTLMLEGKCVSESYLYCHMLTEEPY